MISEHQRILCSRLLELTQLVPSLTAVDMVNHNPNIQRQLYNNSTFGTLDMMVRYTHHRNLNWYDVSCDENITIGFIKEFPNKPWNWFMISQHKNITMHDIKENPNLQIYLGIGTALVEILICLQILLKKPLINLGIGGRISDSKNITINDIKENPNLPWNWEIISRNPHLTIDFIKENLDKAWDWDRINRYKTIPINDIKENPNLPWNWETISFYRKINDSIKENPNLPWDWKIISSNNRNLTIDFIKEFPNKPWDWFMISRHENITMNDIKENPNLPWDWENISNNRNLTIDFIKENPHVPWNWGLISNNDKLPIEFIKENPNLPWDWDNISNNRNLTIDFIKENLDKPWSSFKISRNKFNGEKENIKYELARKRFMGRENENESSLFKELMENVWHPRNFHKFSYLD